MTVKEKLRQEYLLFLGQYGLSPLEIPSNAAEIRIDIIEKLLRSIENSDGIDDKTLAGMYRKSLEAERQRIRDGCQVPNEPHPIEILLERYNCTVEQAIAQNKTYKDLYHDNVYVGGFPTGSINAEVRRVDNGYLVLVNSGLLFFITQIVEALNMGHDFSKVTQDEEVITTLAQAVLAYLHFGDPAAGPMPLVGGVRSGLVMFQVDACCQFVLAHEYGHILSGHLDGKLNKLQVIPTRVGNVKIIKNNWNQEFEADAFGYELTIGGKDAAEIDLGVIDRANAMQTDMSPEGWSTFNRAAKLMSALAAPFFFFQIDSLVSKTWLAIHQRDTTALLSKTHPPSEMRLEEFRKRISWIPLKYLGHMVYASSLWKMKEAIIQRVKVLLG